MTVRFNQLRQGDCIEGMSKLPDGCVDLAFADPPFNIGYDYDEYDDRKPYDAYLDWSKRWMSEVKRVLKSTGAFWLAIGDEYAAELKIIATRELGLTCRNWVVWYYTFGVHCKHKFTRSHAHMLYFVRDPKKFTFNHQHPQGDPRSVRVPSARQLVYGDRRANPDGRMPDDTWIVRPAPHDSWILRPQDLPDGFSPDGDTWYYPRVAGTFKERQGFHGCQMPEQILGRIIKACSNGPTEDCEGDVVLDPFGGSATTLAVAKKLGRRFVGFEMSQEYVESGRQRLGRIKPGDPLDGAENPLTSAPDTASGIVRTSDGKRVKRNGSPQGRRHASREEPNLFNEAS